MLGGLGSLNGWRGLGSLNGWRLGTRADIRGGHYRGTGRYQLGSRRCCNPHVFWIAKNHGPGC